MSPITPCQDSPRNRTLPGRMVRSDPLNPEWAASLWNWGQSTGAAEAR